MGGWTYVSTNVPVGYTSSICPYETVKNNAFLLNRVTKTIQLYSQSVQHNMESLI